MANENLQAGDSECTTGLSKRIFDAWTADTRAGFSPGFATDTGALGSIKSLCWAVAQGVVSEMQEHGYEPPT